MKSPRSLCESRLVRSVTEPRVSETIAAPAEELPASSQEVPFHPTAQRPPPRKYCPTSGVRFVQWPSERLSRTPSLSVPHVASPETIQAVPFHTVPKTPPSAKSLATAGVTSTAAPGPVRLASSGWVLPAGLSHALIPARKMVEPLEPNPWIAPGWNVAPRRGVRSVTWVVE